MNKDLIIQLQQQRLSEQQKLIALLRGLDAEQKKLIIGLQQLNTEQQKLIVGLQNANESQAKTILLFEARLGEIENIQKKNSSNSSKPPSSDMARPKRTQSLRTKSDKKPGGQDGHSGETLSFSATPDDVISHVVSHCSCCGKNLSSVAASELERRQVYDAPPIKIMVTEHQSELKHCPKCNTANKAAFPEGVAHPVQYGPGVQTWAVYLTQFQLLPYSRTAQLFRDLFGHSVSEAFLVNNNRRFAKVLQPFICNLKDKLLQQPVLHADETGYYYNGQRNWLHTLCTEGHTLYMPHAKRGTEAMDEMGVLTEFKNTLVHDFWKPYNEYACKHALCNVHHLRDFTFCEEVLECSWAGSAKQFLISLLKKVNKAKESGVDSLTPSQLKYIRKKYKQLIEKGQNLYPPPEKVKGRRGAVKKSKSHNLLERFVRYKEEVLGFANNFSIPFGNNLAEQAIRMMKIKQKVSGCFRSEQGAKDFATIRSYIATMQKQGYETFQAIQCAIRGVPMKLLA